MLTLAGLLIGIFLVEAALHIINYPRGHKKILVAINEFQRGRMANWWTYDSDLGTRFDRRHISPEILRKTALTSLNWNRLKTINSDGYHDSDEFKRMDASHSALRVLVLGDSFAWGASSDKGFSLIELLEKSIKKDNPSSLLWNTAIPACGTNQQILVLRRYYSIMEPHYVLLCFFENDFHDNVMPLDRSVRTESGIAISRFNYDRKSTTITKLSSGQILAKLNNRYNNMLPNWITRTRIGYIITSAFRSSSANAKASSLSKYVVDKTTELITSINDYVVERGSRLFVLTIPSRKTVQLNGINGPHISILRILKENRISFYDPTEVLSEDDYQPLPDNHWNNSGHQKVGAALYNQLESEFTKVRVSFTKRGFEKPPER